MPIPKLNLTVRPGEKAKASDQNRITATIDQIIDALTSGPTITIDPELDANSRNPVENRAVTARLQLLQNIIAGQEVETLRIAAPNDVTSVIVRPTDEEAQCSFNVQHFFTSLDGTRYQSDPISYEVYTVVDGTIKTIATGTGTTNVVLTASIDRRTWLGMSGTTYVYVKASLIGSDIQVSPLGFVYTVTSLALDTSRLAWHAPYIEGKSYVGIGPVDIMGNVNKKYLIRVQGIEYDRTYEVRTDSAVSQPTNVYFSGLEMPTEGTGVYRVTLWLDADGAVTPPITYYMMFVAASDEQTAQLVCVNDVADTIKNGETSDLFAYSLYNGGLSSVSGVSLDISYSRNANVQSTEHDVLSGNTSTRYTYTRQVDVDTSEELLQVVYSLSYGNCLASANAILDNSAAYTAVPGAVFYLNPARRSNQQPDREEVINTVDNSHYPAAWHKMSWVDGVDGYTNDDKGRACLRIPAHSSADIAYQLMSTVLSSTRGKVIELTYKATNVADYDEPIIRIANSDAPDFCGIRIRPANVTVHSNGINNPSQDPIHGYNYMDEEMIHLMVCIIPNLAIAGGKNLCIIYANGGKKCSFAYDSSDSWTNAGHILLGSSSADLYLYGIRSYDLSFSVTDALRNYYTSLGSNAERDAAQQQDQSVIYGEEVNFDKVMANGQNYFTVEMLTGELPKYGLSKSYSAQCNLEMHLPVLGHAFRLLNQKIEGQGTTSMDYLRWNLRWRIDKNSGKVCGIQYLNADGTWTETVSASKVNFDGRHVNMKRITGKLNYASSMQSHKIGATAAYNDLHAGCVGFDEEQATNMRTAIYQYPAYGFLKVWNDEKRSYDYSFIGLFTIGPDKGDKDSLGWKQWDDRNELLSMEGVDHSPRLAQFAYPWNDEVGVAYDSVGDKWCLSTINANTGTPIEYAWEVGNCHGIEDQTAWLAELERDFKPAYLMAYESGQNLIVLDPATFSPSQSGSSASDADAMTASLLAYMNTPAFRTLTRDGEAYSNFEFIIKGDPTRSIYYYRQSDGKYAPSATLTSSAQSSSSAFDADASSLTPYDWFAQYQRNGGTQSLTALTSLSAEALESTLRAQRRAYFAAHVWEFFNKKDTLFHICFLIIFGASDNFAKNTYPYRLAAYLWRWFQDDLDTLFDINNQAIPGKDYYLEYDDKQSSGAYWFNGKGSNLWNTINASCQSEMRDMMRSILMEMARIGYANDSSRSTWFDRLVGFVHDYFWANAQEYFPRGAYNADAAYKYEAAYALYPTSYNPGVNPLTQSLGSHYEAERQWVERRLLYVMSKYQIGPFVDYTADSSMGQIVWRAVGAFSLDVSPAITMYPTIICGNNSTYLRPDDRIFPGETCSLTFDAGENDTNVYIKGADWLQSAGDFKDVRLLATNTALAVTGKRLRQWKSGDKAGAPVTTNMTSIEFGACPSMEIIDCHNQQSLTTVTGTDGMLRLIEAYFGGTSLATLPLPAGSKLEVLELPGTLTSLSLIKMSYLSQLSYESLAKLTTLVVDTCIGIDQVKLLSDAVDGGVLRRVRVVGIDQEVSAADIELFRWAADHCGGIDANGGDVTHAVLDGIADLAGNPAYYDSIAILQSNSPSLRIINAGDEYIRFEDEAVLQTLLRTVTAEDRVQVGDGYGVTKKQAAVINLSGGVGHIFFGNKDTHFFDEFVLFVGTKRLTGGWANGSALERITFPTSLTEVGSQAFHSCSGMTRIAMNDGLLKIGSDAFNGCSNLNDVIVPSSVTTIDDGAFNACTSLVNIVYPSAINRISGRTFNGCTNLVNFSIPSGVTWIGDYAFNDCRKLILTHLPIGLAHIGVAAFRRCESITISSIPDGVMVISDNAFSYCNALGNLDLGNVLELGVSAFDNCKSLNISSFPAGITSFPANCFYWCSSLTTAELPPVVTSIGNSSFSRTKVRFSRIPDGCTYIGDWAMDYSDVTISRIPGSVESIGAEAFRDCRLIPSLTVEEGVKTIGRIAFYNCTSMVSLSLPSTITSIGDQCFYNTTSLSKVRLSATIPPSIGANAFGSDVNIYVPDASVNAYKSASGWAPYADRIKPISQYED